MIEGGIGGANTKTGIIFEGRVDLLTKFKTLDRYSVKENIILYDKKEVARYYKKRSLYKLLKKIILTIKIISLSG